MSRPEGHTTQEVVRLALAIGKVPLPPQPDGYWRMRSLQTPESPHQVHCSMSGLGNSRPVFSPGCSCRYAFRQARKEAET